MKLQSTTTLLNPISKNTLTNLLNEVRETIALEFGKKQVAALSSAELLEHPTQAKDIEQPEKVYLIRILEA